MRKAINLLTLLTLVGLVLFQVGCSKDEEETTTPPPACSIVLDQFNSWDFYYTGDTINIRWTKTTGGNVMIQLYKGPNPVGVITASTTNSGYYPWLKCSTFGQDSGEDFSIKVTHLDDSTCGDQTNTFEMIDVSNCYIKFPWTEKDTIPDQKAGELLEITWDSSNTTGEVNLELWYEPFAGRGDLVGVIAENLANTGSYNWTVDTFNRGTDFGYRLKIADVQYLGCADRSVPFFILDDENCSIEVLGVNQGQTYDPGEVIPLTFLMENSSGIVDLKLYSGNQQVNVPPMNGIIIQDFDTLNGTAVYNWTVSAMDHDQPAYNRFNIRAFDVDDDYCVGKSSEFTISQ
jgi:hypothetical protein